MKRTLARLSVAVLALNGCSSAQTIKFQKAEGANGKGYVVNGSIAPSGFTITTDLPKTVDDKYSIFYGYRAVGEECLAHGFSYFDVGVVNPHNFEGYCFKTADHPALAVEFADRGLDVRPQKFIVGDLHDKTHSKLQVGDELLAINDIKPWSVATFKAVVFRASTSGKKSVQLKIHRDGNDLTVTEPIADFKNSSMGPKQLDLVRSRVE